MFVCVCMCFERNYGIWYVYTSDVFCGYLILFCVCIYVSKLTWNWGLEEVILYLCVCVCVCVCVSALYLAVVPGIKVPLGYGLLLSQLRLTLLQQETHQPLVGGQRH